MATDGCPNPKGIWFDPRTGERRPTRCGRLRCPWCGPRIALSTANAIVLAAPHSSAVLTLWGGDVPSEPEQLFPIFVRAVRLVAEAMRSKDREWEFVWTLELSPSGIPNAHILQWGRVVSPTMFRAAAIGAGMRWGDLQPIRHLPRVARYALKLALAPLDLGLDGATCMELHLALNGGRLVHASRRFWRDGGRALSGVREARVEARRQSPSPGRQPTAGELVEWRRGWRLPFNRLSQPDAGPL